MWSVDCGRRVRDLRYAADLTQARLAGAAGLSISYISLIETGRRTPSAEAVTALARELRVSTSFLLHGHEGPAEEQVALALDFARLDLTQGAARSARGRLEALDLTAVTPKLRREVLTSLAHAHEVAGDLEAAAGLLERLLAEAHAHSQHLDAATVATALVADFVESGDLLRATAVGEAEMHSLESAGLAGTDEHLRLGSTLLWAYIERGDLLSGRLRADSLLRQAEMVGSRRAQGSVYWNAALLAEEQRDFVQAKQLTARAVALFSDGPADRNRPRLHLMAAHLYLAGAAPETAAALDHLIQAEPAIAVLGSEVERATLDTLLSRTHLLLGDRDAAERHARAAIERLDGQPRPESCNAHLALGDALYTAGDLRGAIDAYRWAADRLSLMSSRRRAAVVWAQIATRFQVIGEPERALDGFARALAEVGVIVDRLPLSTPAAPPAS